MALTSFYANIYANLTPCYGVEAFRHMDSRVAMVNREKYMWGTDIPNEDQAWEKNLPFWQENVRQLGGEDKLPVRCTTTLRSL